MTTFMTSTQLIEHLKEGPVKVTFTKQNGERRIMECTLNFGLIPVEFHPKIMTDLDEKSGTIRVFDLEKCAWRSFRRDSIIDIEMGVL